MLWRLTEKPPKEKEFRKYRVQKAWRCWKGDPVSADPYLGPLRQKCLLLPCSYDNSQVSRWVWWREAGVRGHGGWRHLGTVNSEGLDVRLHPRIVCILHAGSGCCPILTMLISFHIGEVLFHGSCFMGVHGRIGLPDAKIMTKGLQFWLWVRHQHIFGIHCRRKTGCNLPWELL